MKICTKCKVEKSLSEFYKNKENIGGFDGCCMNCKKEYQKQLRLRKNGGKYINPLRSKDGRAMQKSLLNKGKLQCSKCNEVKTTKHFNKDNKRSLGYFPYCKSCSSNHAANMREQHGDKYRKKRMEIYYDNHENERQKQKEYRSSIHNYSHIQYLNYGKEWKEKNRDKVNEWSRDYNKKRKIYDPIYVLKGNIRSRTRMAFKMHGYSKKTKTAEMLGCDWETLKNHLESQFTDGMTWDNMGEWHIDHMVPLAIADTVSDLHILSYYKNLQPLWAEDNLKKSDFWE